MFFSNEDIKCKYSDGVKIDISKIDDTQRKIYLAELLTSFKDITEIFDLVDMLDQRTIYQLYYALKSDKDRNPYHQHLKDGQDLYAMLEELGVKKS